MPLDLPLQLNPLFSGPLVSGEVVYSPAELAAMLTQARRYAGQRVTLVQEGQPN